MKRLFLTLLYILILLGSNDDLIAGRTKKEKRARDDDSKKVQVSSSKGHKVDKSVGRSSAKSLPAPLDDEESIRKLFVNAPKNPKLLQHAYAYVRAKGIVLVRGYAERFPDTRAFLALCLRDSVACEENSENVLEALHILSELSQRKDPIGMHHLGITYLRGTTDERNQQTVETGFSWVRSAVYHHNGNAVKTLIDCLRNNKGCAHTSENATEAAALLDARMNWVKLGQIQSEIGVRRHMRAAKQANITLESFNLTFPDPIKHRIMEGVYPPEIASVVRLFPSEDITKSAPFLASCFFKINDGNYAEFVNTVEALPMSDRVLKLNSAQPCLDVSATGAEQARFLKALSIFPSDELVFIQQCLRNVLDQLKVHDSEPFLNALTEIPEIKRIDVLNFVSPFLKNIHIGQDLAAMFRATHAAHEHRFNLSLLVTNRLVNVLNTKLRISALNWIKEELPSMARDAMLDEVFSRLNMCEKNRIFDTVLDDDYIPFFNLLKNEKERERISFSCLFLMNFKTVNDLILMYHSCSKFSVDELRQMVMTTDLAQTLWKLERVDVRAATMAWLQKFELNQRKAKLGKLLKGLQKCQSADDCAKLLK